ncbi:hypothetical protein EDB81DRAFT_881547 [Dactylonectria macrodidyma]|uniref:Uncharacterized protein n=1 Tax=Dactylonectria macrodidyma TaxID=307937 RepID=A0A9P9F4B0_9HYPO|nr:hypothetical protein EDB81DRAFT_881547 [Dactylonectria macrodidyma]
MGQVEDPSTRKVAGLPSWVPDFSVAMAKSALSSWKSGENKGFYAAAGSSTTTPKWISQDRTAIELSGYKMNEISVIVSMESARDKIIHRPQEWAAMMENLPQDYPSGCSKTEALWRTLIGDRTPQDECPAPPAFGGHYKTLVDLVRLNGELDRRITSGEDGNAVLGQLYRDMGICAEDMLLLMADKSLFEHGMSRVMLERRLFVTKKGYVGSVPMSSQIGDAVYLLSGGHVPFVPRSSSNGRGGGAPLTMISECYLHGVMQREVFEWDDFGWSSVRVR